MLNNNLWVSENLLNYEIMKMKIVELMVKLILYTKIKFLTYKVTLKIIQCIEKFKCYMQVFYWNYKELL